MNPASLASATRKVAWRIVPFLCLLYVFNILDRSNVGFARLGMTKDLGLSEEVINWGIGLFYLGYLVFEVPSNLLLRRLGARVWISRIMISWGLVSMLTLAVTGPISFYWARVMLGVAEAGFFPGVIFYLTAWFPASKRARVIAWFMIASPLANVLGNPVSGVIMDHFHGDNGLAGWQWLFLLEGFPSVLLGILVLFVLPDSPRDARWLAEDEKKALEDQMLREDQQRLLTGGTEKLFDLLRDFRVWILVGLYFTVAVGTNATGAYLPKLVKGHFEPMLLAQEKLVAEDAANKPVATGRIGKIVAVWDKIGVLGKVGLLSALPYLASVVAMLIASWLSDRWRMRAVVVALSLAIAGVGWIIAWRAEDPWLALVGLCMAQAGMMAVLPVFWALPSMFLGGVAAAAGIALINSVANIGGIIAPTIVGWWGVAPMVGIMVYGVLMSLIAWIMVEKGAKAQRGGTD